MKKSKCIVTFVDGYFYDFLKVALKTFAETNEWFDGDFIVYYKNMSFDEIRSLKNITNVVKFLPLGYDTIYDEMNVKFNGSRNLCCHRLRCFEFVDKYDQILVIDSDVLFTGSIKDLFDTCTEHAIYACMDLSYYHLYPELARPEKPVERHNLYFNFGVALINSDKLEKNILRKIVNFAYNMDFSNLDMNFDISGTQLLINGAWIDQDAINQYFNDVNLISNIYNFPVAVADRLSNDELKNNRLVHFIGYYKPKTVPDNYYSKIWFERNNEG